MTIQRFYFQVCIHQSSRSTQRIRKRYELLQHRSVLDILSAQSYRDSQHQNYWIFIFAKFVTRQIIYFGGCFFGRNTEKIKNTFVKTLISSVEHSNVDKHFLILLILDDFWFFRWNNFFHQTIKVIDEGSSDSQHFQWQQTLNNLIFQMMFKLFQQFQVFIGEKIIWWTCLLTFQAKRCRKQAVDVFRVLADVLFESDQVAADWQKRRRWIVAVLLGSLNVLFDSWKLSSRCFRWWWWTEFCGVGIALRRIVWYTAFSGTRTMTTPDEERKSTRTLLA